MVVISYEVPFNTRGNCRFWKPKVSTHYPLFNWYQRLSSRNAQDGTTALMAASVRGHKDVVDALLRHGANVDQQNLDGHTALMFAYNGRNQVT